MACQMTEVIQSHGIPIPEKLTTVETKPKEEKTKVVPEQQVSPSVTEEGKVIDEVKVGVLGQIHMMKERFVDHLQHVEDVDLQGMNTKQLQDYYAQLKRIVMSKMNGSCFEQLGVIGCNVIEHVGCQYAGMKLQGYSQHMLSNPNFGNYLAMLNIDRCNSMVTLSPESQLCLMMVQGAINVHSMNSMVEAEMQGKVGEEIVTKYSEL